MKERLEREFAIVATIQDRRESGLPGCGGTIERRIVDRHLAELAALAEGQALDRMIADVRRVGGMEASA